MTERGGDDFQYRSVIVDGRELNLAHSRLEINSIGSVLQPYIQDDYAILFNGEIYNYKCLAPENEELSEIEVIYSLYKQGGIDSLRNLDGMFAIVIIDLKKQRVICFRDFVGQKPLWINRCENCFEIASDPSYFQVDLKEREHYANYISKINLGIGLGLSCLTGINEVPCNRVEVFELSSGNQVSSDTFYRGIGDFKDSAKQVFEGGGFSSVIMKAVRDVVPDQDFGLFLSGGLDSRAVLTALVKNGTPPKRCFTLQGNETVMAENIANFYGIPIQVVDVDSVENVRIVKSYLGSKNLTSVDPAAIGLVVLSKACRDSGLKVALCGDGGDEALLGYDFFFQDTAKALGTKAKIIKYLLRSIALFARGRKEANLIVNTVVGAHLCQKERIPGLFKLSLSLLNRKQLRDLYTLIKSYTTVQDFYYGFVLPQSLCRKTDTAAHHAKIEVRSPFLQAEFLNAGRAYAESGIITDNTKKPLRDFCDETFDIAPLGSKTGLNLQLEKSIQVLKDALYDVHDDRERRIELRSGFCVFKPAIHLLFILNRKARYASLKVRASSLTI